MAYPSKGIFISQLMYIGDLCQDSGRLRYKATSTPIHPNEKLEKCEEGNSVNKD